MRKSWPQPATRLQGLHGTAIGVQVPLLPDGPDLCQALIRPVGTAQDIGHEPGTLVKTTDDARPSPQLADGVGFPLHLFDAKVRRGDKLVRQGADDGRLAREVEVDGGERNAGVFGDPRHGHRSEPVLGEELLCRGQDAQSRGVGLVLPLRRGVRTRGGGGHVC